MLDSPKIPMDFVLVYYVIGILEIHFFRYLQEL